MKQNQNSSKKKVIIALSVLVAVALIVGAGVWFYNKNSNEPENPKKEITLAEAKEYLKSNWDKFAVDGSTSMVPLHQALNDVFAPGAEDAKHNKTVDSFEKFIKGKNDILLGVTYSDELLKKALAGGVDLAAKEITREGFIFIINKNNPVKSLTVEQIKDIYSGKITNWKEVGGDDAAIVAFQRNDDSGSQIRMNKFMGDAKLTEKKYVAEGMGELILEVAGFQNTWDENEAKYAIGYSMYTFAEKQFVNADVMLMAVNGVQPTDETIFSEEYPIVIHNYIYYDKNNEQASEFSANLYVYLMSEEGQKLISGSGYVNLNEKLDRNKDVEIPYEFEYIEFYNKEKGEFYDVGHNGELIVFKNYPDFILSKSKYKNNENARRFFTMLFDSGIISSQVIPYDDGGTIGLSGIWFDASFDVEDIFNIKYKNLYYGELTYYIETDKYVLEPSNSDVVNDYFTAGHLKNFPSEAIAKDELEISKEELKNLHLRRSNEVAESLSDIKFYQPFK